MYVTEDEVWLDCLRFRSRGRIWCSW